MSAEDSGSFTVQGYYTPPRKRLRRFPALVAMSFRIVWRAARRELVEIIVLQALSAAALGAQLILIRRLLSHLVGRASLSFGSVLPEVAALAVIGFLTALAATILGLRTRLLGQLVALHATDDVMRVAARVDLVTFDHPEFHDRLQRAQLAAALRPSAMVQDLIGAAGAGLTMAGVVVALLIIQPLFCLFVIVAFVPTWIATNRAGQLSYRQSVEQTERERLRQYLYETLTTKPPAQEVRAFDLGEHLRRRHYRLYSGMIAEVAEVLRRRVRMALVGQGLTALLTAAALALLVWLVTSGRTTLAAAGSAASAMIVLTGRLRGLAGSSAGLYEHSLYLEDFVNFIHEAPPVEPARRPRRKPEDPAVIQAEGVSFTYPSRTDPSLREASLIMRRGEVVALVGENGSGKTTFAKILAALLEPSAGVVRWDGVDLRELDPGEVRRRIGVIFQDFTRYLLSARDNIALGNWSRAAEDQAVVEAARQAGIDQTLSRLPGGYDTILGPQYFGGSDLSGGQWQRVALARLFFRDPQLVILDEPAAALDPRAEAELYESMRSLFSGRSVLIISHRFGSVRTADRIYVLRDGRVREEGNHEQLMRQDGYYAELFRIQADLLRY